MNKQIRSASINDIIKSCDSVLEYGNLNYCQEPEVSVIMPVYKRPDSLKVALESVLNQYGNNVFEVVIVDNNESLVSPNLAIVKQINDKRVLYYHNNFNLGMYGNFNRGIQLARGKYITFCHDDDTFTPYTISNLINVKKNVNSECIIGEYNKVDSNYNLLDKPNYPVNLLKCLRRKNFYNYSPKFMIYKPVGLGGGGCLFDKSVAVSIGGFNENYYPACDYEFFIRYCCKAGAIQLPMATYNYRLAENESNSVASQFPLINLHIQKKYLKSIFGRFAPVASILILCQFRQTKYWVSENWGNDTSTHKKRPLLSFLITKILSIWIKLHCYKLCGFVVPKNHV